MPFSTLTATRACFDTLGRRVLVCAPFVLLLLSCAYQQPTEGETATRALLTFLEEGKTTKEDLQTRLGPPSGEFNRGKIWTYSGLNATYLLVVVFGDQDIVKAHRVLKVK